MTSAVQNKLVFIVINSLVALLALFGLAIFGTHDDGGEFMMHLFISQIFILLGIVRRPLVFSRLSSKLNAIVPFLFAVSFPLPVLLDGSLSKTMRVSGFIVDSTILLFLVVTTLVELRKEFANNIAA